LYQMKTLLIMRHANSNWDHPDCSDFERPLNSLGLKVAPFMANLIFENNLQPNLIISSPAKRAKQTAILVKEVAEVKTKINYSEKIYEASPFLLLNLVSGTADTCDSLLLVGHNPGIEGLIYILTGEIQSMSTASIAKLTLNIEKWDEIKGYCGRLDLVMRPERMMERVEI
jgi:phosphohistidine phosphatase